jgi:tetratricopeptide (TPR) repeat protein
MNNSVTATALYQQALRYWQQGEIPQALGALQQSLQCQPDQPERWCQLGVLLRRSGQLEAAIRCYDKALQHSPTLADAYFNRANAYAQAQCFDAAVVDYRQTIQLMPDHVGAQINLGLLYLNSLDNAAAALGCFQALLAIHPDHPDALFNGANAWRALNQPHMAAAWLQRAVLIQPANHRLWVNLALAQEALGQPAAALASLGEAVRLAPDCAEAYAAAGNLHKLLDQLPEAIVAYDSALSLRPVFAEAYVNRAAVHMVLRQWIQAEADLTQALTLRPCWPDAEWHLGMLRLLQGQAGAGWRLLESRWQTVLASRPPLPAGASYLDDSPLQPGVRVLLYSEQGLGDCLQFSRFIPRLIQRGATVSLVCPRSLHPLLQTLSPLLNLLSSDDAPPACDVVGGLPSLPWALGLQQHEATAVIPYLWPNPARVAAWRQRLDPRHRPRIGVAWSGQAGRDLDRCRHTRRRIPLALFAGLCQVAADFHALQKDVSTEDRVLLAEYGIHWHGEQLADFADTAALMAAMDGVISIDTSVAHLAGALGTPLWVLLPLTTDYRWTATEAATPWYPTARLYRQSSPGEWEPALQAVIVDLQHALAQGPASAWFDATCR